MYVYMCVCHFYILNNIKQKILFIKFKYLFILQTKYNHNIAYLIEYVTLRYHIH